MYKILSSYVKNHMTFCQESYDIHMTFCHNHMTESYHLIILSTLTETLEFHASESCIFVMYNHVYFSCIIMHTTAPATATTVPSP